MFKSIRRILSRGRPDKARSGSDTWEDYDSASQLVLEEQSGWWSSEQYHQYTPNSLVSSSTSSGNLATEQISYSRGQSAGNTKSGKVVSRSRRSSREDAAPRSRSRRNRTGAAVQANNMLFYGGESPSTPSDTTAARAAAMKGKARSALASQNYIPRVEVPKVDLAAVQAGRRQTNVRPSSSSAAPSAPAAKNSASATAAPAKGGPKTVNASLPPPARGASRAPSANAASSAPKAKPSSEAPPPPLMTSKGSGAGGKGLALLVRPPPQRKGSLLEAAHSDVEETVVYPQREFDDDEVLDITGDNPVVVNPRSSDLALTEKVLRGDGSVVEKSVTLADVETEDRRRVSIGQLEPVRGTTVETMVDAGGVLNVTVEDRTTLGVGVQGRVVVAVDLGGAGHAAGIRPGDEVQKVHGRDLTAPESNAGVNVSTLLMSTPVPFTLEVRRRATAVTVFPEDTFDDVAFKNGGVATKSDFYGLKEGDQVYSLGGRDDFASLTLLEQEAVVKGMRAKGKHFLIFAVRGPGWDGEGKLKLPPKKASAKKAERQGEGEAAAPVAENKAETEAGEKMDARKGKGRAPVVPRAEGEAIFTRGEDGKWRASTPIVVAGDDGTPRVESVRDDDPVMQQVDSFRERQNTALKNKRPVGIVDTRIADVGRDGAAELAAFSLPSDGVNPAARAAGEGSAKATVYSDRGSGAPSVAGTLGADVLAVAKSLRHTPRASDGTPQAPGGAGDDAGTALYRASGLRKVPGGGDAAENRWREKEGNAGTAPLFRLSSPQAGASPRGTEIGGMRASMAQGAQQSRAGTQVEQRSQGLDLGGGDSISPAEQAIAALGHDHGGDDAADNPLGCNFEQDISLIAGEVPAQTAQRISEAASRAEDDPRAGSQERKIPSQMEADADNSPPVRDSRGTVIQGKVSAMVNNGSVVVTVPENPRDLQVPDMSDNASTPRLDSPEVERRGAPAAPMYVPPAKKSTGVMQFLGLSEIRDVGALGTSEFRTTPLDSQQHDMMRQNRAGLQERIDNRTATETKADVLLDEATYLREDGAEMEADHLDLMYEYQRHFFETGGHVGGQGAEEFQLSVGLRNMVHEQAKLAEEVDGILAMVKDGLRDESITFEQAYSFVEQSLNLVSTRKFVFRYAKLLREVHQLRKEWRAMPNVGVDGRNLPADGPFGRVWFERAENKMNQLIHAVREQYRLQSHQTILEKHMGHLKFVITEVLAAPEGPNLADEAIEGDIVEARQGIWGVIDALRKGRVDEPNPTMKDNSLRLEKQLLSLDALFREQEPGGRSSKQNLLTIFSSIEETLRFGCVQYEDEVLKVPRFQSRKPTSRQYAAKGSAHADFRRSMVRGIGETSASATQLPAGTELRMAPNVPTRYIAPAGPDKYDEQRDFAQVASVMSFGKQAAYKEKYGGYGKLETMDATDQMKSAEYEKEVAEAESRAAAAGSFKSMQEIEKLRRPIVPASITLVQLLAAVTRYELGKLDARPVDEEVRADEGFKFEVEQLKREIVLAVVTQRPGDGSKLVTRRLVQKFENLAYSFALVGTDDPRKKETYGFSHEGPAEYGDAEFSFDMKRFNKDGAYSRPDDGDTKGAREKLFASIPATSNPNLEAEKAKLAKQQRTVEQIMEVYQKLDPSVRHTFPLRMSIRP
eukprot:g18136.t1